MRETPFLLIALCIAVAGAASIKNVGCGKSDSEYPAHGVPSVTSQYIIGGVEAQPHSWPWQVVMKRRDSFTCGGSLIRSGDTMVVVTAAHCTDGSRARDWTIDLGVHSRTANEAGQKSLSVTRIEQHPSYSPQTLQNDIALMFLDSPVVESETIKPICIDPPVESTFFNNQCVVTGWGTTNSGSLSANLQQVFVPVLEHSTCNANVAGYDSTTMICAGLLDEGGKDACQGDSGGPLACRMPNTNDEWTLVGIVSWGYGCAEKGNPGVYANVYTYLQWIKSKLA